jgi:hypothetical protein
MKKSVAQCTFIFLDCGSVSKSTKGLPVGFTSEPSFPPFNRRLL